MKKHTTIGPRIVFMRVEGSYDKIEISRVELLDQHGAKHVFKDGRQSTVRKLMKVLDSCDILVTWDGDERDVPLLTAWCLHVGADPSPLYKLMHVDLRLFVKQYLKIYEPELDKTAKFLKVRRKADGLKTLEAVFEKLKGLLRTLRPELAL